MTDRLSDFKANAIRRDLRAALDAGETRETINKRAFGRKHDTSHAQIGRLLEQVLQDELPYEAPQESRWRPPMNALERLEHDHEQLKRKYELLVHRNGILHDRLEALT